MAASRIRIASGLSFRRRAVSLAARRLSLEVYNVRTEGNSEFLQVNGGTGSFQSLDFLYLGIRTIANQTDLNYQATKWLSAFAGYHYSDRFIRNILDSPVKYDQTSI